MISFTPLGSQIYTCLPFSGQVIQMDLFWSGLTRRASEHTWNERKSQFSKVHESALRIVEKQKPNDIDIIT